jgi:hypothetical protein
MESAIQGLSRRCEKPLPDLVNHKDQMKDQEKIAQWFDLGLKAWKHAEKTLGLPELSDFEKALYFNGIEYIDQLVAFTREYLKVLGRTEVQFMDLDAMVRELYT